MVKRVLAREFDQRYVFMPVQSGFGATTLDLLCCINGLFVAIETKAPRKKLTPRQTQVRQMILDAGGMVFVVSCNEHMLEAVNIIRLKLVTS